MERMISMTCGCGKPGVYTHIDKDGNEIYSCNKHVMCPTYDELFQRAMDIQAELYECQHKLQLIKKAEKIINELD